MRLTYFLWKVSLKILNSGLILKSFTHAFIVHIIFKRFFCHVRPIIVSKYWTLPSQVVSSDKVHMHRESASALIIQDCSLHMKAGFLLTPLEQKYWQFNNKTPVLFLDKSTENYTRGMFKNVGNRALGYKNLFSCSTQLSMKFVLLINVKMPTTAHKFKMATAVGILTFISRINTTHMSFKARNQSFSLFQFLRTVDISCSIISFFMRSWHFMLHYFKFYEQLTFHAPLFQFLRAVDISCSIISIFTSSWHFMLHYFNFL